MNWQRVEETDEGGNVHAVVLVTLDDGRQLRLSPTHTDEEIPTVLQREMST